MHWISPRALLLVAIGGSAGALTRWQLAELMSSELISLALINLIGSLLIGILTSLASEQLRTILQVGFLGSFTSMSAVIVLIQENLTSNQSIFLILLTLIAAPIVTSLGIKLVGQRK